jgi:hypothetical protein
MVNRNESLKFTGTAVVPPTFGVLPMVAVTGLVPVTGLPLTTNTAGAGAPGVMIAALAVLANASAEAAASSLR